MKPSTKLSLKLTVAQYRALRATARGEVYRTRNSITYTITGPCSSIPLWALARADLIADPPGAEQYGRHQMVLTSKGCAALILASSTFASRDVSCRSRVADQGNGDVPDHPYKADLPNSEQMSPIAAGHKYKL